MQDDGQDNNIDKKRRHFLTAAATVVGGAGALATAIPFVSTLSPSAKTKAIGGPVEVDVTGLKPGERKTVKWRGKPVWILRRSEESVAELAEMSDILRDPESDVEQQPEYAKNSYRSVNPEYLVVVGLCTHLGCSPNYLASGEENDFGADWKGGFFCPCHGSKFDLAGRVYKGVPAPANLVVPKYQFISETTILIGDDSGSGELGANS
ncbi:MAG: ubiquinol-cytochrome c reductase iron-sulfur subunit [Gammaproteobacteria bacterium]|nr:MAG: ubiquinol-cytochrome c reductase iron-sulfur subunit [Gammaproteobacteria bacterium]RKZ71895.1 MAG: ubiquinol-cytochrome c reductase iron-sulfur subunit [Gammaproteobacteria bacterium]